MKAPSIALVVLALVSGAAAAEAEPKIVREARAFMAAYERDLRARDREAVVARYHSKGLHGAGQGRSELFSRERVAEQYEGWTGPADFAYRDLRFEALGPDSVLVAGLFDWTNKAGEAPRRYSYTAVLTRDGDALRIRVEDESGVCPPR